eukprot:11312558-Karenia_brevis.AAC.1
MSDYQSVIPDHQQPSPAFVNHNCGGQGLIKSRGEDDEDDGGDNGEDDGDDDDDHGGYDDDNGD